MSLSSHTPIIHDKDGLLALCKKQFVLQQKPYSYRELGPLLAPELRRFAAQISGYYHDALHPQDGDINEQFYNASIEDVESGFAQLPEYCQQERLETYIDEEVTTTDITN